MLLRRKNFYLLSLKILWGSLLNIVNLSVAVQGHVVLSEFSLHIGPGEVHAVMGPNGTGKSTLAKVLAGDPRYEVLSGEVWLQGMDLLTLSPEERAHQGLFVGFQYPIEIGVNNFQFLFTAYNEIRKAKNLEPLSQEDFSLLFEQKCNLLEVKKEFFQRNVNEGFSGGEKKRNEILQMSLLDPSFMVLDETDSGLDIDAMRLIASGIKKCLTPHKGLLLFTHYRRLLDYLAPDFVHVMAQGKLIRTGGMELVDLLEKDGYQWMNKVSL